MSEFVAPAGRARGGHGRDPPAAIQVAWRSTNAPSLSSMVRSTLWNRRRLARLVADLYPSEQPARPEVQVLGRCRSVKSLLIRVRRTLFSGLRKVPIRQPDGERFEEQAEAR